MKNEDIAKIAALIGAITAALLGIIGNVLIKLYENRTQKKQKRKEDIKKFHYPLLRACLDLDNRIAHILRELTTDWFSAAYLLKIKLGEGFASDTKERGYFFMSSIYLFASFFGWIQALKNGIGSIRPLSRKRNIYSFDPSISKISKLFQYKEAFQSYKPDNLIIQGSRDSCDLHKQFQHSIGELMIEKDEDKGIRCKSFREFFESYKSDSNFRFWFSPLENLLVDLCNFPEGNLEQQVEQKRDLRPLRLLAIGYWCRILMLEIGEEISIKIPPPDDVLKGMSEDLTLKIKYLEINNLDSFLGNYSSPD